MLLSVGTKVRLKTTGDKGVVKALLDNGMVNVYLVDDDLDIPVFPDALERMEELPGAKPAVKAKIIPGKQKKTNTPPPSFHSENQYQILKSHGIQLAFLPKQLPDGTTSHFEIYLINDMSYGAIYSIEYYLEDGLKHRWNGKIEPVSYIQLGKMQFDHLNDGPEFEAECRQLTTLGSGKPLRHVIRIKPKRFFKKIKTAPLLNLPVHWYLLFESLEETASEPNKEEDLRTYTRKNARPLKYRPGNSSYYQLHDLKAFAEFETEIDLHIEKLVDDHSAMSNAEIIRTQLSHFETYLHKAVRLGVPRVFVIHGVGKGKLRDSIATLLLQNPHVQTFKNEYHPRYGWGATEVIF